MRKVKTGAVPSKRATPKVASWVLISAVLLASLAVMALTPLPNQGKPEGLSHQDKTLSPYFVVLSDDPEKDALPLKSTRADIKIAGKVAVVTVSQVYKNQGKKTLEAIYVFPGSTRAAVHAMRMTVGDRVIEAEIMERQQARQTYEDAKKAGHTTSLLEQQRPNVFQMNVANILPGDEVKVELKYLELLKAEDKVYEFVYPTVVGPRYSKMLAAGAPDTEKWVQNPYLHEGQAPPYTFGLTVDVQGGLPLTKLASPSHEVDVKYSSPQAAQVTLKDEKVGGNRDFVLRYTLAGNKIDAGLLLYPGKDENFFLLVMEPPARVKKEAAVPREYIFIVDVSGSMHGYPLDISKTLMKNIITRLRPKDSMNVLLFASSSAVLSESGSLPATEDNKKRALEFIQARQGGGGTNILPAFKRALALPRIKNTSRIVVVATDGYVRVEPELFEVIRQNLGNANLFPFGIGTSVNRFLIEGMARAGKGDAFVILKPGEAGEQAERFRRYIETPVLTGIKVAFSGFDAYKVEPDNLPDLFALRPLTLLGKYRGDPQGTILVTGKTAAGNFRREIKVDSKQASPDNVALKFLWARERIHHLSDYQRLARGKDDAIIKDITNLGLKYGLMTAYTSFVAVDKVKRANGTVETVKQPLPLPQGVSDLAVGGGGPYARAMKMAPGFYGGSAPTAEAGPDVSGLRPGGALPITPSSTFGKEGKESTQPSTGIVKVKVLRVKGQLEAAAVQQALETELSRFEKCWQAIYKKGMKLPLGANFLVSIGPDGKLTKASLMARIKLPGDLDTCLVEALKQIIFPKPAQGQAEVVVRFMFKAK